MNVNSAPLQMKGKASSCYTLHQIEWRLKFLRTLETEDAKKEIEYLEKLKTKEKE